MGSFIAKLADDKYVEFSTVVDAPTSYVMSEEAAKACYGYERVERAKEKGSSLMGVKNPEQAISFNRAGPGETCITREAIIERYASAEAYENFELTPYKVLPYTVDIEGVGYWMPWKPDQVPEVLPEGFLERKYDFLVPMD